LPATLQGEPREDHLRQAELPHPRAARLDAGLINGSHHIYRHAATGRRTVVPVHASQDLKPGTQRGILRDTGLTDDDL
jgi:hypothetical protein